MKKPALAALALAAAVATARPAAAQEEEGPPPSGLAFMVIGGIFTGVGVAGLAAANACTTSAFSPDKTEPCLGVSLGIGAAFAGIGIPMLVTGVSRRMEWNEYQRQHRAARLLDLRVVPTAGGAMATWQGRF